MKRQGFSLVEVLLAIGIFSLCGIGLVAALAAGVRSAGVACADYSLHLVAENIRARIAAEPAWPPGLGTHAREFHLDLSGFERPPTEAKFKATLRLVANPNWNASNHRWVLLDLAPMAGGPTQRFVLPRTQREP